MDPKQYEITSPVSGFSEGDILDVTARFGDWHTYELKLEPSVPAPTAKSVVVTDEPAGFTEAEILDPTARFGDWHTYELAFEPVGRSSVDPIGEAVDSPGPIELTKAQLDAIAKPIEASG